MAKNLKFLNLQRMRNRLAFGESSAAAAAAPFDTSTRYVRTNFLT